MMKRLISGLLLLFMCGVAFADPWHRAQSRNAGNYIQTYAVTVSSSVATQLVNPAVGIYSANIDIFNNSAYTLWVGTNTTTLQTSGFPVKSSTTYTTDGTFTGTMYGLADSAAAGSINARTIYYMKNDALR